MSTLPANLCRQELERVIRASSIVRSARVVLLTTRDREEAIAVVQAAALAQDVQLRHVTPVNVKTFDAKRRVWSIDAILAADGDLTHDRMVEVALASREPAVVLLEEFLNQIKDGSQEVKARLRLLEALADTTRSAGAVLVLIETPDAVACIPGMMVPQVTKLSIGYPKLEELTELVKVATAQFSHRTKAAILPGTIAQCAPGLAEGLLGLTRKSARDVLQDALALQPSDMESTREILIAEKSRRLSAELSMEVLDTRNAEVPYGIDLLLEYLEVQKARMRVRGRARARGVLLVGPPGTGKTMLARAIGKLVDLPVVNFRVHALMGSLVGQTENRFAEAFATLEALSPCIVFIDEIDKAFGGSGTELDGGTMSRVTGSLLSWLGDNESPNFVIGTSNNLTRLAESSAMTRAERFDATFLVDVPDERAREKIIGNALARIKFSGDIVTASRGAASISEHFSGADLFAAIKHAGSLAEYAGRPVTLMDITTQIDKKRPRAEAQYRDFDKLRAWAAIHCEPAHPAERTASGQPRT